MEADTHFTPGPPEGYQPGDVVHGYLLLEQVSRTALGEVCWTVLDRDRAKLFMRVAPNVFPANVRATAVVDHLHAWSGLRHPQLLAVVEYFRGHRGRFHVVTESGEQSLADLLGQHRAGGAGGLERRQLLPLVRDVADALDHMHRARAVHRDVKPANVYVTGGRAKLAMSDDLWVTEVSASTQVVMAGSPAYMAPEVWAGRIGHAADQYSLALAYAELRQGRSPVASATMTEIMSAHLEGRHRFDTEVFAKDELAAVRRALAEEPGKRFETCSAFVRALG